MESREKLCSPFLLWKRAKKNARIAGKAYGLFIAFIIPRYVVADKYGYATHVLEGSRGLYALGINSPAREDRENALATERRS
jgi:Na+/proline symporter